MKTLIIFLFFSTNLFSQLDTIKVIFKEIDKQAVDIVGYVVYKTEPGIGKYAYKVIINNNVIDCYYIKYMLWKY